MTLVSEANGSIVGSFTYETPASSSEHQSYKTKKRLGHSGTLHTGEYRISNVLSFLNLVAGLPGLLPVASFKWQSLPQH